MRYRIVLFYVLVIFINDKIISQNSDETVISIKGNLTDKRLLDTIVFKNGTIDKKYFETSVMKSEVKKGKFEIITGINYPQMYSLSFLSEKGKILSRGSDFFIESSTMSIKIDSIAGCSKLDGITALEYKDQFLPFISDKANTCKLRSFEILRFNDSYFDAKLLEYTLKYPDSFVALWVLIQIVSTDGHSILYEDILNSFTKKRKAHKLWKLLKNDLGAIRIKENSKFPALHLKDEQLTEIKLKLPKSKYTLVDYWFNNCRPCLDNFPKIMDLYNEYNSKGFEVIGISVDRTNSISGWQKRIEEYRLPWLQYLDENGIEAKKDKIYTFPTTFLLDQSGKVLAKNIGFKELEEILRENL